MKLFAFIVLLGCPTLAHAQEDVAWRAALQNPKVQQYALQLARSSIIHWLDKKQILALPNDVPVALQRRCGVIVTYEKRGQIAPRGCRGTIEATKSNLAQEIIANAIAAATRDARVKPLQRDELAQCRISLTVVLATKPIQSLAQHDAHRNGLIAQSGLERRRARADARSFCGALSGIKRSASTCTALSRFFYCELMIYLRQHFRIILLPITFSCCVAGCSNLVPRRARVMPTPAPIYQMFFSNSCEGIAAQRRLTPERTAKILKQVHEKSRWINGVLRSNLSLKSATFSVIAHTDLNCQNPRMPETFVEITGAYAADNSAEQQLIVDGVAKGYSDAQIPVYNRIGQTRS